MSILNQTFPNSDSADVHIEFLKLYPIVERHARVVFRSRSPLEREEAVAEAVAGAFVSYVRLKAQGKDPVRDFPSAMATFAALHVKDDRKVGGSIRSKDVFSRKARRKSGFRVHQMSVGPQNRFSGSESRYDSRDGQSFADYLQDNMQTPIPDQVAFRIDFPAFLRTLTLRDRSLARFLSLGHSAKAAAYKFGLSPGRITQLRQHWQQEWQAYCDERRPAERVSGPAQA